MKVLLGNSFFNKKIIFMQTILFSTILIQNYFLHYFNEMFTTCFICLFLTKYRIVIIRVKSSESSKLKKI